MSRVARTNHVLPGEAVSLFPGWRPDFPSLEHTLENWPRRMLRLWDEGALGPARMAMPAIDVYEDGNDIVVQAEVPGISKDALEISLDGAMLTISGSREEQTKVKEEQYYRCERSYGSFSRSVELPRDVQVSKAQTTFTNGLLEIRLPVTEEARHKAIKLKVR